MPFSIITSLLLAILGDPSTAPTSQPARESLFNGAIHFIAPDGWTKAGSTKDGRNTVFLLGHDTGRMVVNVDPQDTELDAAAAGKISLLLCKQIRDNAAKESTELTESPHTIHDDRFFIRIEATMKKADKTSKRLQIYRVIGSNLVAVAITLSTDDAQVIQDGQKTAEMVLEGATGGKEGASVLDKRITKPAPAVALKLSPQHPVVLAEAKLRVPTPVDWTNETTDQADGIVVVFHDSHDQTNLIAVSARQLPAEAKKDPKLRDAIVEEMASGEESHFKIEGAEPNGTTERVVDRRFLKKTRTNYHAKETAFQITTRQIRVGNAMASVTALSLSDVAPQVEKLADELALGIRAAAGK